MVLKGQGGVVGAAEVLLLKLFGVEGIEAERGRRCGVRGGVVG